LVTLKFVFELTFEFKFAFEFAFELALKITFGLKFELKLLLLKFIFEFVFDKVFEFKLKLFELFSRFFPPTHPFSVLTHFLLTQLYPFLHWKFPHCIS
jgi:hypothetical protein